MPALPPGYCLHTFAVIDSTNEEARRLVDAGAQDGVVVWAHTQTAGRGRRGREWVSESGNLFASVYIQPEVPLAQAAQMSFVTALAVSDSLDSYVSHHRISLKWPNDVLIDGAKTSGILLEATTAKGRHQGLIIGVGINLVTHPEHTPFPATDLRHVIGRKIDPEIMLEKLLVCFDTRRRQWIEQGFGATRRDWLASAHRLGQSIDIRQGDKIETGLFKSIDKTGALLLERPNNRELVVGAGDVYFPND